MVDLSPAFIMVFIIIWFLAGLITGLTSFGGNLFAVPLISLFLTVQNSIFTGCMIGTVICGYLAFHYRVHIRWKAVLLITCASFAGVPVGALFLKYADEKLLLLTASAVIFLFLLWQYVNSRLVRRIKTMSSWFVILMGLLSGVMVSCTSLGGPPLAIYVYMANLSKDEALGTLNFLGGIGLTAATLSLFFTGLYDIFIIKLSIYGSIASFFGIMASFPLIKRMPLKIFRLLLLGMLGVSASILFYRAIV